MFPIYDLVQEIKAQKIMAELEKEKENTKTNKAHLEPGEVHVAESHEPKKPKLGAGEHGTDQIGSC